MTLYMNNDKITAVVKFLPICIIELEVEYGNQTYCCFNKWW